MGCGVGEGLRLLPARVSPVVDARTITNPRFSAGGEACGSRSGVIQARRAGHDSCPAEAGAAFTEL
jgi:hypothetical protein